jgi:hypothetical protein
MDHAAKTSEGYKDFLGRWVTNAVDPELNSITSPRLRAVQRPPSTDTASLTVAKETANCVISGWRGKYDGLPHGASGSCTGTGGLVLSGLNLGETFANVPGGTDYLDQSGTRRS